MTTTTAVDGSNYDWTALNNTAKSGTTSTTDGAQERFLKLLVTQMKNQDPLNPLDNAQVTSQIAQLNTVTGIEKVNATLANLAASFGVSQTIQAASLVGHGVMVPGSGIDLVEGTGLFGVQLPQSVDELSISIEDGAGKVVHTMDIGPHEAGTVVLGWDGAADAGGTAADGAYRFVVKATAAGEPVSAAGLSFGQVMGVSQGAGGVVLNLGTNRTAALNDVKQVM